MAGFLSAAVFLGSGLVLLKKRHISRGGKMRKILVAAATLLLCSCSSYHRINVTYGEQYMDECPSRAKEGNTVRFTTMIAADADTIVKVSDTDTLVKISEGVYEFTMPDTDVDIEVHVIANNGA